VIGDLLPAALGIGLSPVPVIAVVVILGAPSARSAGPGFAFGWMLGLLGVAGVAALIFTGAENEGSPPSIASSLFKIACGSLFLFLAVRKWRNRTRKDDTAETPKWVASLESATPWRAFVLGITLSAVNPKNLALAATAAASIDEAGLAGTSTAIAVAAFVVLSSLTILGPVLFYFVAPKAASTYLASIRQFMTDNGAVIVMVILLIMGGKLLGDGLSALFLVRA
jgi:threonine/homoserine/homoserine lactone efflux protein